MTIVVFIHIWEETPRSLRAIISLMVWILIRFQWFLIQVADQLNVIHFFTISFTIYQLFILICLWISIKGLVRIPPFTNASLLICWSRISYLVFSFWIMRSLFNHLNGFSGFLTMLYQLLVLSALCVWFVLNRFCIFEKLLEMVRNDLLTLCLLGWFCLWISLHG